MKPESAPHFLNRLAILFGALLVGFMVLISWQFWADERTEQVRQLSTVLELTERSADRSLLQLEAALGGLAQELSGGNVVMEPGAAAQLLRDFKDARPDLHAVCLLSPEGAPLASSWRSGPTFCVDPERSFLDTALSAARSQPGRVSLARPMYDAARQQWVVPVSRVLREPAGQVLAVLSAQVPVELLQAIWGNAPVAQSTSVGLILDNGYLLGRHPLPSHVRPEQAYGIPRSGSLQQHLLANGHPERGYVEGVNQLGQGETYVNVYARLAHFPATVFAAIPLQAIRSAWWQRVRVPFGLLGLLGILAVAGHQYTLHRQRVFNAAQSRNHHALMASEAEQRFLVEHLMAGVVIHSPDGAVRRCNPQACQLLGLTADQVQGKAMIDPAWQFLSDDGVRMPPEDYPVARVIRSLKPITDLLVGVTQPNQEQPHWLLCNAYPELNPLGKLKQVVVLFIDITARRLAEQTLERSEHRYRMLYENNLDGVLQTQPGGRVLAANPAACAIFGLTEAELCAADRSTLMDYADPRLATLLKRRAKEGRAQGEITMLRGDGSRFEAEISSVIYHSAQGEELASVVLRDVTDRRRAAMALAAKELAEKANQAKTDFVASMSHELRTPLNAILGFAEVMRLDPRESLSPTQTERLQHIHRAGKHLLSLINDLLQLSRIEAGNIGLELDAFDPLALAREVVGETAPAAMEAQLSLLLQPVGSALPLLIGDRLRIKQILLNLLSNAVKYNRPGGQVHLAVQVDEAGLRLTVRDTGLGMTSSQLEGMFQPFNRLGRESSRIEGTGIGLVITRGLIDLMNGQLQVQSEPGQGSCFELQLPLQWAKAPMTSQQQASSLPGQTAASEAGIRRVIYVDDDEVNRVLMEGFLALRPDLALTVTSSGTEALSLARQDRPDLLLVDMMMPGMNGLQVLQAMRADERLRSVPCIAVSANAMPQEIAQALAAGFDGYVTKPVMASVLHTEIDRALQASTLNPPPA
ncbi:ATP-binding protein [Ideonella sp.]|uniref:hybrid sensor histidine kinase/response regulator n=1 Tax=Ideonella sp. TaxID=1929293 RepID=UPI003BB65DA5